MYNMKVSLSDNSEQIIPIDRPELIYGATAITLNYNFEKSLYAINPVTKEKMKIIKDCQNRFVIPLHNEQDYNLSIKYGLPRKLGIMPYFIGEGEEAINENKKTIERHSLIAIIQDVDEEKVLCEDMKNSNGRSFVQGGIEEGETIIEAAKREIYEETGYKDVSINYISEIPLINHFFAAYKGAKATNRFSTLEIVYGKLNSLKKDEISDEEKEKHEVKWVLKDELKEFININHNLFALDNKKIYDGDGIIVSNDENNKKKSQDVRNTIIEKYCI